MNSEVHISATSEQHGNTEMHNVPDKFIILWE